MDDHSNRSVFRLETAKIFQPIDLNYNHSPNVLKMHTPVLGNKLSMPESVMGLTLLAAGMSIPETISGVIVANQGQHQ